MLQIISNPKDQQVYQEKIETLLGLLKIYHDFTLPQECREKAAFIIGEDDERGVYGGAVLYSQQNEYYPSVTYESEDSDDFRTITSAFQPRKKEIWIARICLCIGDDKSDPKMQTLELMESCENFYRTLYQVLTQFQQRKRIGLLSFILRTADLYNTHVLQDWLCLIEIKPKEGIKGFFYGILDPSLNRQINSSENHKIIDFSSKPSRRVK